MATWYRPMSAAQYAPMIRELTESQTLGGRPVTSWNERTELAGSGANERLERRITIVYGVPETQWTGRDGAVWGAMPEAQTETYAFNAVAVAALTYTHTQGGGEVSRQ